MSKIRNNNNGERKIAPSVINGEDGIVGNPNGVDTNSLAYKQLQEIIRERSPALTEDEKREIEE